MLGGTQVMRQFGRRNDFSSVGAEGVGCWRASEESRRREEAGR